MSGDGWERGTPSRSRRRRTNANADFASLLNDYDCTMPSAEARAPPDPSPLPPGTPPSLPSPPTPALEGPVNEAHLVAENLRGRLLHDASEEHMRRTTSDAKVRRGLTEVGEQNLRDYLSKHFDLQRTKGLAQEYDRVRAERDRLSDQLQSLAREKKAIEAEARCLRRDLKLAVDGEAEDAVCEGEGAEKLRTYRERGGRARPRSDGRPVGKVAEENERLRQQLSEARKEIAQLLPSGEIAKAAMEEAREATKRAEAAEGALAKYKEDSRTELALREAEAALTVQLGASQKRMASLEGHLASAVAKSASLESELAAATSKGKVLEDELREASAKLEEVTAALQRRDAEVADNLTALARRVDEARTVDDLQRELATAKDSLRRAEARLGASTDRVHELEETEARATQLAAENDALRGEVHRLAQAVGVGEAGAVLIEENARLRAAMRVVEGREEVDAAVAALTGELTSLHERARRAETEERGVQATRPSLPNTPQGDPLLTSQLFESYKAPTVPASPRQHCWPRSLPSSEGGESSHESGEEGALGPLREALQAATGGKDPAKVEWRRLLERRDAIAEGLKDAELALLREVEREDKGEGESPWDAPMAAPHAVEERETLTNKLREIDGAGEEHAKLKEAIQAKVDAVDINNPPAALRREVEILRERLSTVNSKLGRAAMRRKQQLAPYRSEDEKLSNVLISVDEMERHLEALSGGADSASESATPRWG
eukprot:Sspe_Gene.105640::Locus_82690_Transcript_2_3_Confidence_0.500_Length_2253::g.105640::m.105640